MELYLKVFLSIISIINPLGTIPVFLSLTTNLCRNEIYKTSLLTSVYVLSILFLSYFFGNFALNFFDVSIHSLRIAGGIVVASSGFALLTGTFNKHKGIKKKNIEVDLISKSEIAFTPLAIPMLASPGTISMLIGYRSIYHSTDDSLIISLALISVVIFICLILIFSNYILKFLGSNGLNAISRVIGFFLITIGTELIFKTILTNFIMTSISKIP